MNAITLAPSWELINKDQDVKDLDWKDTQQCMDYFKLSNWGYQLN